MQVQILFPAPFRRDGLPTVIPLILRKHSDSKAVLLVSHQAQDLAGKTVGGGSSPPFRTNDLGPIQKSTLCDCAQFCAHLFLFAQEHALYLEPDVASISPNRLDHNHPPLLSFIGRIWANRDRSQHAACAYSGLAVKIRK